jgi:hypothetical protein
LLESVAPRNLLSFGAFNAVTATVMDNNPEMSQGDAERIVTDALAFVATAAANPQAAIAPSRIVDEGWHALVLHTALYAGLCRRLGHFVHHYPERPDPTRQEAGVLERTVALMRKHGYSPDMELWTTPLAGSVKVAASCGHAPNCGPIQPIPAPPKPPGGSAPVLTA